MKINAFSLVLILLLILTFAKAKAQELVKGVVTDSITHHPLPFVSVFVENTSFGSMTDNSGKFTLRVPANVRSIKVKCVGYYEKSVLLRNYSKNHIKVKLAPESYSISELTVKPKKVKYRKKDNPAVIFMKKVIADKAKYSPYNKAYYSYRHDEKINFAINNFDKDKHKKLLKRFPFIANYIDTSKISGKPVLPVSSREVLEDYYYRKSPRIEKRIVLAKKHAGIDDILPQDGVQQFITTVFKNVNVYDNNIYLFLKKFVSPLSTGATDFYKFYLLDTVKVHGQKCIDVGFVPFTSQSTGFTGQLYITMDSTYFITKVHLNLPRDINLNFVRNMTIEQEFKRAPDGTRLLTRDDIVVEFTALEIKQDIYAERISTYTNHSFACPADSSVFTQKENTLILPDAGKRPSDYWKEKMPKAIPVNAKSVDRMLTKLRKKSLYSVSEKLLSILVNGYIPINPSDNKFTYGPVYSTVSSNTIEGWRFRVGGFTTTALNKHLFAKGYLAYGVSDKKLKYDAQLEYSFNKKKKLANEFPVNSLRASVKYDLNRIGQNYQYSTPDNLYLSLKRLPDDKLTYQKKYELSYNREFYSQFSYGLDYRYTTDFATTFFPFTENFTQRNIPSYSLSELELRLRYAPGEKYYQTPGKRASFSRKAPVFSFSQKVALKELGSDYSYISSEIGFRKRFWFSAYGNSNVILKAGKIWSSSPFPLLGIPNANLTYTNQYESFSLINALEFITDQYLTWDVNYNMNGIIMNHIPLIKYLKLREILSFRGFYGSLSRQNDPAYTSGLFNFPSGSYRMGNVPYMEAAVGLSNILNLFRVDYVWRLNYLNHPGIDKSGIRVSVDFNF